MKKKILIFGSTGSIGVQTLDVMSRHPELFELAGISANNNYNLLNEQMDRFKPKYAAISNAEHKDRLKGSSKIFCGSEGLLEMCRVSSADIAVIALVGLAGLPVTIECIKNKMTIALANKETLVGGGAVVTELARENNVSIIPVDSEHSAIFQCLQNDDNRKSISKLILTASGGPFCGYNKKQLEEVSTKMALRHPNWNMGGKITIDSATLMNKGLEVIEARWLFNVSGENIEVAVHKKSIVHSMVEFVDGSILAQMGMPDMRIPIQYALTYPKRVPGTAPKLDIFKCGPLDFEKPDTETFSLLALAYDALNKSDGKSVILNAANEIAVHLFLTEKISFNGIMDIVHDAYGKMPKIDESKLEDVLLLDKETRIYCMER